TAAGADLASHHQLRRAARGRPSSVLAFLVGPGYFSTGASTSSACAAPLASSTEATSQPRAGVFACWLLSIESGSEVEPPPAATALKSPLETTGWNGSNNAEPIVSTIPPGTSEKAFTVYLNAVGLAAFC